MTADLAQLKHAEELVRRAENTHRLPDRFHWLKCAASIYHAAGNEVLANAAEEFAEQTRQLLEKHVYHDN